jgi:hypothetical protein
MNTNEKATATIHRCPVILTRYLGPTNTRGSRVKAKSGSGASITVGWDHELDSDQNHAAAAIALAVKIWGNDPSTVTLRGGCHDGCDGFAWTLSRPGVFA